MGLKSYAGGRVAYGRVFLAGQVKNEFTEKERPLCPSGWGMSIVLISESRKKQVCLANNTIRFTTEQMF